MLRPCLLPPFSTVHSIQESTSLGQHANTISCARGDLRNLYNLRNISQHRKHRKVPNLNYTSLVECRDLLHMCYGTCYDTQHTLQSLENLAGMPTHSRGLTEGPNRTLLTKRPRRSYYLVLQIMASHNAKTRARPSRLSSARASSCRTMIGLQIHPARAKQSNRTLSSATSALSLTHTINGYTKYIKAKKNSCIMFEIIHFQARFMFICTRGCATRSLAYIYILYTVHNTKYTKHHTMQNGAQATRSFSNPAGVGLGCKHP